LGRSALHRQRIDRRGALDTRNGSQAPKDLIVEAALLPLRRISRFWNHDRHRKHVARLESGIDGMKLPEAADEQTSAHEKHERERDFRDDETAPEQTLASLRSASPETPLERLVDVALRPPPRRCDAAKKTRGDSTAASAR